MQTTQASNLAIIDYHQSHEWAPPRGSYFTTDLPVYWFYYFICGAESGASLKQNQGKTESGKQEETRHRINKKRKLHKPEIFLQVPLLQEPVRLTH